MNTARAAKLNGDVKNEALSDEESKHFVVFEYFRLKFFKVLLQLDTLVNFKVPLEMKATKKMLLQQLLLSGKTASHLNLCKLTQAMMRTMKGKVSLLVLLIMKRAL